MAYKFVGKAVPRLEGAEKVSGKTRYAADVDIPDALWARILRSHLPHFSQSIVPRRCNCRACTR
jgi:CO/xanthine dehydrogenase Mo-binding subunit